MKRPRGTADVDNSDDRPGAVAKLEHTLKHHPVCVDALLLDILRVGVGRHRRCCHVFTVSKATEIY